MVQDCIRCRETIEDDFKMAQHDQKREDVMYNYICIRTYIKRYEILCKYAD